MLSKLAKKMTSFFISRKLIEESKKEVYDESGYIICPHTACGERVRRDAVNAGNSVVVSTAHPAKFNSAGGYHAKTHFGCLILLLSTYIVFLLLIKFISGTILFYLTIIFSVFSLISVFLFAPVENINNPLTNKEKIILARKSILYTIIILSIVYIILSTAGKVHIGFSLTCGLTTVCLFLPIGKFVINKNIKNK